MTPVGRAGENELVVAVTGAARGIGRATVEAALRRGASATWMLDVQEAELEQAAAEIREWAAGDVLTRVVDVSSRADVAALAVEWQGLARAMLPRVLVNAAGVRAASGILDAEDDEWDRTVGVNLTGTFAMLRMSSRLWTGRDMPGVFVAIASIGGEVGFSERASYCASKAGVLGLVRAAALDLARSGVRVLAVSPGFIATDMSRSGDDEFVRSTPSGQRFGPDELARLILDIADSRLITGTSITADGGLLAGYRL